MKYKPGYLALFLSFATIVSVALFIAVFTCLGFDGYLKYALSLLTSFISLFLLFYYVLNKFIYDKIKIIYKSITKQKNLPEKTSAISDLREVEKEVESYLEERKEELEELTKREKYRKEFLGNISHELKTPITNIQGYLLTLLDGGIHDPKINHDFLMRAAKNATRLEDIVKDLEQISLIESGMMQLKPVRFNLQELIDEVAELYDIKLKDAHSKLVLKIQQTTPIMVFADRKEIKTVISNLIDNAIKYGKEEEGVIEIAVDELGNSVFVEISDNGNGIEEQHIDRLFERFYRTDKARSRHLGGSGLGLAIVKHIIEAHQQTIRVRSTIGEGTVFTFGLNKG